MTSPSLRSAKPSRSPKMAEPTEGALDLAALEFLRAGIGLTLVEPSGTAQPAYVSRSADDDGAVWSCTCAPGRRGKGCAHIRRLQPAVDGCHAAWQGRSWQPALDRSLWTPLAQACFAADARTCAGLRSVAVLADGRPAQRVETEDGALRALVPRDVAGRRLLDRLGLGPSGAGEGSRARLLDRLQRLQATPTEHALNDRDTYTHRQAYERSFYGRLAYHLAREHGDGLASAQVDPDSTDFLLMSSDDLGREQLRFVLPREAVAAVLAVLRQHAPAGRSLAPQPVPLRSLFQVRAETELDVEVRPMIEALQATGEARLFDREELERFRYGRLVYLPDMQVLAELEPPGSQRRFKTPTRMTLARSQVPAFVQHMEAQSAPVVDARQQELVVHKSAESLVVDALGREQDDYWADVQCVFGGTELPLASLFGARAARLPYLEVPGGWVDLAAPGLGPFWSLRAARDESRRRGDSLRLSSREVLQLASLSPAGLRVTGETQTGVALGRLLHGTALEPLPTLHGLRTELRAYQRHGVDWLRFLHENGLAGLLCDDMGLGKTHQVMALLVWLLEVRQIAGPFLVVCPTSVVPHWHDKLCSFAPALVPSVFHGGVRALPERPAPGQVVITSYGVLRNDVARLSALGSAVAVFDEAQQLTNRDTATHRAALELIADMKLGLTGTPIENDVRDLKALLDVVLPGYLGGEADFSQRHSLQAGPTGRASLRRRVAPFVLRRIKQDVLHELPAKIEDLRRCALSDEQRQLYRAALASRATGLREQLQRDDAPVPYLHVFAVLSELKRICDHPALVQGCPERYLECSSGKWELFTELLDEALEAGQKVVVFSQYLGMLDIMARHLTEQGVGHAVLTGQSVARGQLVRRFNEDPDCRVFLGSLKAGGVGIDLVAASVVIHYDRWWNAAREDQATDRVHRIGQQRAVQVFKLVTEGTLEERIATIIEDKRALLGDVVASDDPHLAKLFTRAQLLELLAPA